MPSLGEDGPLFRSHLYVEEMKKNDPVRPNLKMKERLQKLIFLWLILSITFSKTLVYFSILDYFFFFLAKFPCIIQSSCGLRPHWRGGKGSCAKKDYGERKTWVLTQQKQMQSHQPYYSPQYGGNTTDPLLPECFSLVNGNRSQSAAKLLWAYVG